MNSFLKNTAETILRDYPSLDRLVLVFPNRRAGLFFARHLGNLIDVPHWMPQIKTIEEVFYGYAGKRPADQLTLLFELYNVYSELHPLPEAFDRFYYWGEMILRDFNDLDNFLVDAARLYHQLEELKGIENDLSYLTNSQIELIREFWKSFEVKDRAHQEKFLKFWKLLRPLYENFRKSLSVSGLAYSGQLYRQVVEQLHSLDKTDHHHIFIGFNAFSLTEEKLIKHFIQNFGAEIFWDLDLYYMDDLRQEAGLFFRKYQKDQVFGNTFPKEITNLINGKPSHISVYQIPLKINQANLVGRLMEQIEAGEALEETVIILPDEQMLFPVLHTLPETISKVNVTMGYPVKNSPAYGFLESLLELQRFVSLKEGKVVFYHQPVRNILSTPYFRSLNHDFVVQELRSIEETNQVYISAERLEAGGEIFGQIFQKVAPGNIFTYLKKVIQAIVGVLDLPELQQNYLYQCFKQLNRLDDLFQQQKEISVGLDFLMRLFKQVFREVKLPFEGEPLEGLQVMGVLESRNLDFKRVIICNMNEGSFPPSTSLDSMVPFNLRRAFGLPVQEQNDAIYAYTFLRLLQGAEEVHLLYTTESDEGKVGEKSRYIQQLELESKLQVTEETVFVPVDLQPVYPITILKNKQTMDILSKYLVGEEKEKQDRLSPSAINVWLDCRLKFYFKYVALLQEREDVQEKIDPAVFGNLAHYSLEFLYQGFKQRKGRVILEKADFAELKNNWIDPAVQMAIKKHYSLPDKETMELTGHLIIACDVIQRYIRQLLEVDESYAPFEIISLEGSRDYKANLTVKLPQGDLTVGLKGIIDRVDRKGNSIRLVDYKSGADKKEFADIPSLFDRNNKTRNKAAMQTMMYGLLFQQSGGGSSGHSLKPAIFNLKDIFHDDFNPYLQMKLSRNNKEEVDNYLDLEEEFISELMACLREIFHPEVPFDQTEDDDKCLYCPFNEICSRK